jgi:monofunctional glycosyltransferase
VSRHALSRWASRAARAAALAIAVVLALPLPAIVALRWIDPPASAFMIQRALARRFASDAGATRSPAGSSSRGGGRAAAPAAAFTGIDYRWTDLEDIAPAVALAAVAAEDQLFPRHHGFDLESISEAVAERDRRRRVRGASTITQQVAKNLFLWPGRSLARKGLEAYLAALIELAWPKRRILEIYLNVAELGPDLYGVGAAADVYFRKTPAQLTRREAALLAAALPNPKQRRPDRPSPWLSQRAAWIDRQVEQLGGGAHLAGVLPAIEGR